LDADLPSGSYYLAGYAVECALKACLAKATKRHEFPDLSRARDTHTHSLNKLMLLAGLTGLIPGNSRLSRHWEIVQQWSETSRYSTTSFENARDLLAAVTDSTDGILTWLKRFW